VECAGAGLRREPDGAAPWADVDPPAAISPPVAGAEGPHTRPGWLTAGRPDDAA